MTDAFCWQTNVQDPTIGDRENAVGAIFKLGTQIVFVDVDDTLVRSVGTKRIPSQTLSSTTSP